MLLNLPSFPGHCHRVPVGSGEASHLGNCSFNSFPCDLDVAQCYQLLGLSSGLTKSRQVEQLLSMAVHQQVESAD